MDFMITQTKTKEAVEKLLPIHMMSVAIDKLYMNGWEVRLDTRGYLNRAMLNVLQDNLGLEHVIAERTERDAMTLLKGVDYDSEKVVLLSVSYFILKLVDEKLYEDNKNQAVLSALMITADAELDGNPDWVEDVPVAKEKAGRMLDACLQQGFYNHVAIAAS